MVNYFIGQDFDWLEGQLKDCQEDISVGKTLLQWGAGDSSAISKIQLTPQARFELIYSALVAFETTQIAAGTKAEIATDTLPGRKYPKTNLRVRRTQARYLWGF